MDEENRKERKNARREYDETVRQLVAFVKKRDPRFKEWLALTKKEQEERRSAETERRKREQEERFRKAEEYVEPDWVRNAQEVELEDDIDSEEQEPQTDSIYCVVCNKKFKSEKQRINHLQSKKHLETLSRLREVLLEDDILEEDEVFDKKDFSPAFGGKDISAEIPSHSSRRKKKGAKKKKRAGECLASDSTENTAQASTFRRELAEEVEKLHVVEDFGHITAGAGDDQKIKEGGHAVRKARRRKQGKGEEHTRNACDICGIRFDSRNKMFQHIRDTGHASYK